MQAMLVLNVNKEKGVKFIIMCHKFCKENACMKLAGILDNNLNNLIWKS